MDIRPRIPGSSLLVLVVENIGQTPARDVRITVDPPLETTLGAERAAILARAVGRPIATLPPKRRLPFVMDVSHRLYNSDLPLVYEFRIEAVGPFGPIEPLVYTVDLEALKESALDTDSPEWSAHLIAGHLEKSAAAHKSQSQSIKLLTQQLQVVMQQQATRDESPTGSTGEPDSALLQVPTQPLGDGFQ
ncbi:hypothetical protein [Streptomyces jumonjinensis]|uniref:Uncharacterized protein n=1 Tax=Streptomyces jumonjinensis TaxID=1945 RepID=A0A646KR74_STRJU|nr:hypothetical protein [Streptomyces jumonjinensis]MQT04829.1 hypothetical protein [Streptomyces jumonjinensis]